MSVTAKTEDYSITLTLDSPTADGSRKSYTLDVKPQQKDGTVMLPLDFVAEQLGYSFTWDEKTNTASLSKLNLTRDEPKTDYHKWVLARARQITDFTFTPVKDIPIHLLSGEHSVLEAGKTYNGFPYSSTEGNDKFICENVSFETLLSALANPDSALYTKNMYHASNASAYFGMVCNGYVRYCLGIKTRCNTQLWLKLPGMRQVAAKNKYTVDDLELCDVLHAYGDGVNHVAIITGILSDESGKIVKVEVSDQTLPTTRRRLNSVEDFEYWRRTYKLCRYDNISFVPPFDEEQNRILFESGIEKTAPMVAVDFANKSNYIYGQTTVISSFAEGDNTLEIYRDGALIDQTTVNGYKQIQRQFPKGYYVIKLAGTEYFTEFCVCRPEITHQVQNGVITINASAGDPESKILHMEFRNAGTTFAGLNKMIALTDEEKESGEFSRTIPSSARTYKISLENKYGIWTHTVKQIY